MGSAHARDLLDLPAHLGQRSASYRFDLIDGRTGVRRGALTPLRGSSPSLSHDGTSTIARRVSGLTLGVDDAARVNPVTDRIAVWMVLGDAGRTEYPLGRYMIGDAADLVTSAGSTSPLTLFDEMFLVDQEMEIGFDAGGQLVDQAVARLLDGLPIGAVMVDATEFTSVSSWSPGTSRASALRDLAASGGYFMPWFGHQGLLRLRRAFDPASEAVTIDLDASGRVIRGSISRVSGLLDAPNRFVAVSNDPGSDAEPVVGVYDVPASAPHSIARRGFVLPKTVDVQVRSQAQATVYARTLGIQQTVYETVELSTPADPRHDAYDVVRWNGRRWLEVGWTLPLVPGGAMRHTLRRAYADTNGGEA
ncbi:hypothetical protein GA0070610_1779 [Micromonospora echinofusca]|uniref:Uncharacterized protein n=1 Tax=Micromonospora echinofusca TaxID=47858 RepID=A0A1C5G6L1_MICEH|nr:hypothetical protein [Micromonospora echinofusca]SCG15545.1 hypothetical protein GA0070610_1779 [Micromonospora echinofusca]